MLSANDEAKKGAKGPETKDRTPKHKVEEKLLVESANTLPDPWTMVIVLEDASSTRTTMVTPIRFHYLVSRAVSILWVQNWCSRRPAGEYRRRQVSFGDVWGIHGGTGTGRSNVMCLRRFTWRSRVLANSLRRPLVLLGYHRPCGHQRVRIHIPRPSRQAWRLIWRRLTGANVSLLLGVMCWRSGEVDGGRSELIGGSAGVI